MKKILFTFMALLATLSLSAEEPKMGLQNVELKNLRNEASMLPWYGEKHILVFYVDPDRHKQNETFTYELEESRRASSEEILGFGVLNLKDTMLPSGIVRTMARKRTEKNGALVLADEERTLATEWGLGDCNNCFTLIFVTKEGEIAFLRKGELTEEDKQEFYRVLDQYR